MKLSRLRGRKICETVLRKGYLWKGRHFLVRWLPGSPSHPSVDPSPHGVYLGTLTSTKLHKSAVKRNRMKRRCREAWRITLRDVDSLPLAQLQLLLIPRSSSLVAPFPDLQQDVRQFLSRLHATQEKK